MRGGTQPTKQKNPELCAGNSGIIESGGEHPAACRRSGILRSRGLPLERPAAVPRRCYSPRTQSYKERTYPLSWQLSPVPPMLMATIPCSATSFPRLASTKPRLVPAVFPRTSELQPWTRAWRTLTSRKTACGCRSSPLHWDRKTPVAERSEKNKNEQTARVRPGLGEQQGTRRGRKVSKLRLERALITGSASPGGEAASAQAGNRAAAGKPSTQRAGRATPPSGRAHNIAVADGRCAAGRTFRQPGARKAKQGRQPPVNCAVVRPPNVKVATGGNTRRRESRDARRQTQKCNRNPAACRSATAGMIVVLSTFKLELSLHKCIAARAGC